MRISPVLKAKWALYKLPSTELAIAHFLLEKGMKGVRRDPCHCPIANYLKSFGLDVFTVTPGDVNLYNSGTVSLPKRVSEFILAFDKGQYEGLVDKDNFRCIASGGLD